MTILLENVNQQHLSILNELAKSLKFKVHEMDERMIELNRRIENVESGKTKLITPDWESIIKQAQAIR